MKARAIDARNVRVRTRAIEARNLRVQASEGCRGKYLKDEGESYRRT